MRAMTIAFIVALLLSLAPAPAPATAAAPFDDEFTADTLNGNWTWVRQPAPGDWSLTAATDKLRIVTRAGNLIGSANNVPVLIKDAPGGDFEVSTRVTMNPTQGHHQGGLVVYTNDDNLVEFIFSAGSWCGRGFYIATETTVPSYYEEHCLAAATGNDYEMRLVKSGTTYTGGFRTPGGSWTNVQAVTSQVAATKVGLVAHHGTQGATSINVDFDWFHGGQASAPTAVLDVAFGDAGADWPFCSSPTGQRQSAKFIVTFPVSGYYRVETRHMDAAGILSNPSTGLVNTVGSTALAVIETRPASGWNRYDQNVVVNGGTINVPGDVHAINGYAANMVYVVNVYQNNGGWGINPIASFSRPWSQTTNCTAPNVLRGKVISSSIAGGTPTGYAICQTPATGVQHQAALFKSHAYQSGLFRQVVKHSSEVNPRDTQLATPTTVSQNMVMAGDLIQVNDSQAFGNLSITGLHKAQVQLWIVSNGLDFLIDEALNGIRPVWNVTAGSCPGS